MKQTLLISSLLLLFSCGNIIKQDSSAQKNTQNAKSFNSPNALVVKENCVIFLWPDSTEIAKLQAETDEDAYNEIIADMTWYPGVATEVLDSFQIKSIACNQEYLILKNSQNKETKLKRTEMEGDMILFRVDKDPVFTSAIEFDRELTLKYFEK